MSEECYQRLLEVKKELTKNLPPVPYGKLEITFDTLIKYLLDTYVECKKKRGGNKGEWF